MLRLTAFVIVFSLAAPAQDALRPIFDGKTLKGWTQCNGNATYKVDNGTILGTTVAGSPNSFLCTDREYGDFVLELEIKNDVALNSGVQIRSHRYAADSKVLTNNGKQIVERKHPAGRVYGYQVEVATETGGASGGIYDEARRGWLHNVSPDPAAGKAFKDNQWNKYRIEAEGDHIRTWINGVACADVRDSADLSGFIGLQVHAFTGEKPAQVRFRNIRIQDKGRHTWKSLFDGKTMSGWEQKGPGKWTIEDGAFHAVSVDGETRTGTMMADRDVRDVTLRVMFRMLGKGESNSGIFVRADKTTLAGYEVEIDEKKGTGGLFEVGGRRWVTGPEDNAALRVNDWNEMIASLHGDRLVFHLNGIKTLDLPNDTQGKKEGRIALQIHNKRTTEIFFKDVAILEKAK
ncbi:MAG: DUF1080 domain-containing protein [Candidatus Solibacter usitatus]|nr:DUF1080 domain-containing protein [Candidatus Solibacter usitatus]